MRRWLIPTVVGSALMAAVLSTASAAAAPAGTVTLSDSTDLVHGQEIVIRGEGWDPRLYLDAYLCAVPSTGNGCERAGWGRPGSAGRFGMRVSVDVILDQEDGVVDCRIEPCQLVIRGQGLWPRDPPPVAVGVTFDPAGADPPRLVVGATPTAGLVDGQVVTVTTSGLDPGSYYFPGSIEVRTCVEPVDGPDDCDHGSRQGAGVADDGTVEKAYRVDPILHVDGSTHDCRAGGCALLVNENYLYDAEISEAAIIPIAFDPSGPLRPSASVTAIPPDGLVDDQEVRVRGSGFDPDDGVEILQCIGPLAPGPAYPPGCNLDVGHVARTDGDGEVRARFAVRTRISAGGGPPFSDCRRRACFLVLRQYAPVRQATVRLRDGAPRGG